MPRDGTARAIAIQVAGITGLLALVVAGGWVAWQRMRAQGFVAGFDVLLRQTGWPLTSPFLAQDPTDPYWWTLTVALVNTAAVGVTGIVLATALGTAIGIALLSGNKMLTAVCRIYVEAFRNVPLVLQAVFWYVTFTKLPTPRANPPNLFSSSFLTNKGFFVPALELGLGPYGALAICAALAVVLIAPPLLRRTALAGWLPSNAACWLAGLSAIGAWIALFGSPSISIPRLEGFSFKGGRSIPIEFIALTFGIVIFSAAYIAEIVRGGLLSVPKGQIEAAKALGLPPLATFIKVRFPIALRSIVPPLGNQYVFVMKATSLGLAVGYSDIFSASVVSISQSGQSIEFLVVMMAAFFVLNYAVTLAMNWLNAALSFEGAR